MSALRLAAVVVTVLLACAPSARAQGLHVREVIGADGDAYEAMTIDERVWIATASGVSILDGARVAQTLGVRDGLMGLRARSISLVNDGIWIGGPDGAAHFDRPSPGGAIARATESIDIPRVQRVARFGDALYVATAGRGLLRRTAGATRFEPVRLGRTPAFMHVTDLLADGDSLWVSTVGAGLLRLDANGRVADRIGTRAGLASDIVWRIYRDANARLVVATSAGISVVRGRHVVRDADLTLANATLPIADVRAVSWRAHDVFVATFGAGIFRFEPSTRRFDPVASTHDVRDLTCIASTLVATSPRGIDRIDAHGVIAHVASHGLASSDVTALVHAFGALWIGTFDRGLSRRNDDGTVDPLTVVRERWHVDPRINDLARTDDDTHHERLWIATDRGLYVHDGRSFVPVVDAHAPGGREHVSALHVDRDGALWAAGTDGLFVLDPRTDAWTHIEATGDDRDVMHPLGAITSDARGVVWAGGLHGLFEIEARGTHITRHAVATGDLPVDWVTAVATTRDGIVAGTYHGGLVHFRGARAVLREREGPALPTGWVNPHAIAIAADGSAYFGSLDRGLVVGSPGHWRAFTLADGLPGNDVTAIAFEPDGSAWIGTRAGLVRVEPH